jgi:hypothetical protein
VQTRGIHEEAKEDKTVEEKAKDYKTEGACGFGSGTIRLLPTGLEKDWVGTVLL